MRRNSLLVYYLLRLMIRAHIKQGKILSEYSNNRNQFISKAGAIFVQAIWASTSLLTDSFCCCILKKWESSFDKEQIFCSNVFGKYED